MSAEIIALNEGFAPTQEKRREDIVELLSEVLEQAKRGEVSDVILCVHRPNQEFEHMWSGNRVLLLGLATALVQALSYRVNNA